MGRTGTYTRLLLGLLLCLSGVKSAVAGVCVSPDGTDALCCDVDGDFVTDLCQDGFSYFLIEEWCAVTGGSCEEPALVCVDFPPTTTGGVATRGCYSAFDCADEDPVRYPPVLPALSSIEVCDGKDNDCTSTIDDGFDQDGDAVTQDCGAGVGWYVGPSTPGTTSEPGCYTDEGDVSSQSACQSSPDCHDGDSSIYPPNAGNPAGATEVCDPNGTDENCNGLANDADPTLSIATTLSWYPDIDQDGFGDAEATPIQSCDQPGQIVLYTTDASDCADMDPGVHPGAQELCNGEDEDCDGLADEDFDLDDDGTSSCGPDGQSGTYDDDCDDENPRINPGYTETCDKIDNNCNAVIDEGFDADGDTYSLCGADGIEGTDDDDCNDLNEGTFPGAPERCNGIDDDCNALIDDNPQDTLVWWRDQDGDGFGDSSSTEESCQQPTGHVATSDPPPEEDCNDQDPSVYPGAANERLDGSDTNCDSQLPLIELDCDGDGQYPVSRRLLAAWQSGMIPEGYVTQSCTDKSFLNGVELGASTSTGHSNDSLLDAESLGLEPCAQGDIPPQVSCLGLSSPGDFTVVCDLVSNLWVIDNYTDAKALFDAKRSALEVVRCDSDFADCNDQRSAVCGCTAELCDGLDTNCAEDGKNVLDLLSLDVNLPDGVPDAMQSEALKRGSVSLRELDFDADGALFCTPGEPLDGFNDDLYRWSSAGLPSQWAYQDCDDQCALKSPGAIERCDGVPNNTCLSDESGQEQDPGLESSGTAATCGFMSSSTNLPSDALYVLVYDACPECAGTNNLRYIPLTDLRSTLPYPAETKSPTGCAKDGEDCLASDPTSLLLNERLVSTVGPYEAVDHPDSCLPSGLARVHYSVDPALELLRLCLPENSNDTQSASRCKLMRLELSKAGNETVTSQYNALVTQSSALCSSAYSARLLWPADRVRSARDTVALWHCILSGQCLCVEQDGSIGPVTRTCPQVTLASVRDRTRVSYPRSNDLISVDSVTSLSVDLGPFIDPEFVGVAGWLSGCWATYNLVGGGCPGGNRDTVEGPRDIYGRLTYAKAECDTCIDGLDNNCNGLADENDPGCYACFEGQGISCACNPDATAIPAFGGSLLTFIPLGIRLWRRRRVGGKS